MKHSPLAKYLLYCISSATFSLRHISSEEDWEYLHSLRVSLRLIRSLLQLYDDQPPLFPVSLKSFLKATNLLRDLDVLILSLHQKSSQIVVKQLVCLRNEHYTTLFTDESKMEIFQTLNEFYDCIENLNLSLPNDYLIQTAHEYYKESLKEYTILTSSTSQKELHKLRIRFKISRYAFDFLYDSGLEDTTKKLGESKKLQDKLGEIHDLYTQIKLLKMIQKQKRSKELAKLVEERKKWLKKSKRPLNSE